VKLPRSNIKRGRVEIIPMIDTILILLIFYMSFSTFKSKEKQIDAKMPALTKDTQRAGTDVVLDVGLHVKGSDSFLINDGASHNLSSLREAMKLYGQIGQKVTVVVSSDPDTEYQAIINALDACALARRDNQNLKVAFRPLTERLPTAKP
jgi:biopolymer transport protein ExbD